MKLEILQGDVFEKLKEIENESIDLCITSPPYWGLRDYGVDNQLGAEPTMEKYLDNLLLWVKGIYRVLKPTGSFVLNMGDCFVRPSGNSKDNKQTKRKNKGGCADGKYQKHNENFPKNIMGGIYKTKQFLSVSSFAYCKIVSETDFVCRGEHIWAKPNVPSPIRSRLKSSHEKLFWFVKDADNYYFDKMAWMKKIGNDYLKDNKNKKRSINEQLRYMRGKSKGDNTLFAGEENKPILSEYKRRKYNPNPTEIAEYLKEWKEMSGITYSEIYNKTKEKSKFEHYFRTDKSGCALPSVEDWIKLKEILQFDNTHDKEMLETEIVQSTVKREEMEYAKNIGNTFVDKTGETIEHSWRIIPVGERQKGFEMQEKRPVSEHVAPFPTKLIEPYIKSLCPPEGTVLDPFLGSGTTMRVSMENRRNCVGIELNKNYINYAKKRLNWGIGLNMVYEEG